MARPQSTSAGRITRSNVSRSLRDNSVSVLDSWLGAAGPHILPLEERGGNPRTLEGVIENERARLSHAQSILSCLHAALRYAEETRVAEPGYAEVAGLVCRLLRESVHRLDSVYVAPLLARLGNRRSLPTKRRAQRTRGAKR